MPSFCRFLPAFVFSLFVSSNALLIAQTGNCGISVDAGPDQVYCTPGQTLTLAATVSGDYLSAAWSPATGLSNPSSLNTMATANAATTYTLTVRNTTGPNLVSNGDFSQGNTGFTSQYTVGTGGQWGPVTNPGTYGITTVANLVHSQFAPCDDHTGGGNMMVVNGASSARDIWCQTVVVQPNTDYAFSAWFAVVATQNPSILRFAINGSTIGNNFTLPTVTCEWTRFFRIWNSGVATSAQICISNVSTMAAGNDFCLDDISLRRVCETTDILSITPANLDPSFNAPASLCQNSPSFALQTLLAPGSTPGGTWTVNGVPATAFNPTTSGPGTYNLKYRVQAGQCADSLSRTLNVSPLPLAGTPLAGTPICSGSIQTVSLTQLLAGADPGGSWTETSALPSSSGAFNAAAGTLQTQSLPPGTYTFQYRVAGMAPCPDATATVTVIIAPSPVAVAGPDQSLDCRMRQVSIGGNASSSGQGITYTWASPSGGMVLQPGLPITDVDIPGTYVLTVRNSATGCEARDTVVVADLITEPQFSLDITPVTCAGDTNGAISVSGISGAAAPLTFSLNGGTAQSGGNFAGLTSGAYTVRLEDANGCFAEQQANLPEPPPLSLELASDLGDPAILPLGDSTRLRILSNLSPSEIGSIIWDPAIPDCMNCLSAMVRPTAKTTYTAVLTDKNGCRDSTALTIFVEQTQRIFVPNAFSPNDDGINDKLFLHAGAEVSQVLSFRVADRWGNIVFQQQNIPANDPQYGWDGKVKGKPASAGVFIYVAEVELINGVRTVVTGDAALLR